MVWCRECRQAWVEFGVESVGQRGECGRARV